MGCRARAHVDSLMPLKMAAVSRIASTVLSAPGPTSAVRGRCTNDIVNQGLVHDLEPIASRSHQALSKVFASY